MLEVLSINPLTTEEETIVYCSGIRGVGKVRVDEGESHFLFLQSVMDVGVSSLFFLAVLSSGL